MEILKEFAIALYKEDKFLFFYWLSVLLMIELIALSWFIAFIIWVIGAIK